MRIVRLFYFPSVFRKTFVKCLLLISVGYLIVTFHKPLNDILRESSILNTKESVKLKQILHDEQNWTSFLNYLDQAVSGVYDHSRSITKGWPPMSNDIATDKIHGFYDLKLTVFVDDKSNQPDYAEQYSQILELLDTEKPVDGSELKRLYHRDKRMRVNDDPADFLIYPQFIDVPNTINKVKKGLSLSQKPINNPSINVLQLPKDICCPNRCTDKYNIIVLIKTCAHCFSKRNRARHTYMNSTVWGNFNIKFIFVLGIPGKKIREYFQFDGFNVSMKSMPDNYKDHTWLLMQEIIEESEKFNDMLIGAFEDTYFNLTMKMMLGLRWADVFCQNQSPLFFFIDDDMAVVPKNLIGFVNRLPDSYKTTFIGGRQGLTVIVRPGDGLARWSVSENEVPWPQYTPYYLGIGYILGSKIVQDISILSSFTRPLRIDDAFLGILLKKLRIPMIRLNQIYLGSHVNVPQDAILIDFDAAHKCVNWTTGILNKINV